MLYHGEVIFSLEVTMERLLSMNHLVTASKDSTTLKMKRSKSLLALLLTQQVKLLWLEISTDSMCLTLIRRDPSGMKSAAKLLKTTIL